MEEGKKKTILIVDDTFAISTDLLTSIKEDNNPLEQIFVIENTNYTGGSQLPLNEL